MYRLSPGYQAGGAGEISFAITIIIEKLILSRSRCLIGNHGLGVFVLFGIVVCDNIDRDDDIP